MDTLIATPLAYGNELARLLETAEANARLTISRYPRPVRRFDDAMELFSEGVTLYADKRLRHAPDDPRFLRHDRSLKFFNAARGSVLSGAILTFQHRLFDASKPLRGALESSLAAVHVHGDVEAWVRWCNRPSAEECRGGGDAVARLRKETGAEFTMYRMAADLRPWSTSLTDVALELYDELNDLGAHFNFTATRLIETDIDARELTRALGRLNKTAAVCLRIFDLLFAGFYLDAKLSQRIRAFAG